MSRIKVTGDYDVSGNYVLTTHISPDGDMDEIYMIITPNQIFGIGNSIGGYWAKPITYADQPMLALIRLSGSEMGKSPDQLRHLYKYKGAKGFVLKPMVGLWATSSGAARNGIFHRWNPPVDEIEETLDLMRYGRKCLHRVASIEKIEVRDGGATCPHQTGNGQGYITKYDGLSTIIQEATIVQGHMNDHHNGCESTPNVLLINGGTYVMEYELSQSMNESWIYSLLALYVTPKVNIQNLQKELCDC